MKWVPINDFNLDVLHGSEICSHEGAIIYKVTGIGEEVILVRPWIFDSKVYGSEICMPKSCFCLVMKLPPRWRAERGGNYFLVLAHGGICTEIDSYNPGLNDDNRFKFGNYFRTKEQAQEFSDEMKNAAFKLHEKYGE